MEMIPHTLQNTSSDYTLYIYILNEIKAAFLQLLAHLLINNM